MLKKGQRKIKDPCAGCGLNRKLCLCAEIPHLDLKTKVTLIIHAKELSKTTNTGRLAHQALGNSQILVRGEERSPLDVSAHLSAEYENVLLFPAPEAIALSADWVKKQKRAIHLIVPDGNWRQAQKVMLRQKELKDLPRVYISKLNESQEHLRRETSPFGRSTLEAIAEALSAIEGRAAAHPLFELYQLKLQRTLRGRPG